MPLDKPLTFEPIHQQIAVVADRTDELLHRLDFASHRTDAPVMQKFSRQVMGYGIEYRFKLHPGFEMTVKMFVVMNQHSPFFRTGVFSFLVWNFIINAFGEAEAALLRSLCCMNLESRNNRTNGNACRDDSSRKVSMKKSFLHFC